MRPFVPAPKFRKEFEFAFDWRLRQLICLQVSAKLRWFSIADDKPTFFHIERHCELLDMGAPCLEYLHAVMECLFLLNRSI